MGDNRISMEYTSEEIGRIAAKAVKYPGKLTLREIKALGGSALTQRPDRGPDGGDTSDWENEEGESEGAGAERMVNEKSAGGREDRRATRAYLRRAIKLEQESPYPSQAYIDAYNTVLRWVLKRQKRYDAKEGGL